DGRNAEAEIVYISAREGVIVRIGVSGNCKGGKKKNRSKQRDTKAHGRGPLKIAILDGSIISLPRNLCLLKDSVIERRWPQSKKVRSKNPQNKGKITCQAPNQPKSINPNH